MWRSPALGGLNGLALIGPFGIGGGVLVVKTQRGNIDFDQVRLIARQGTGGMFQMFSGTATQGHALVFDGNGNASDAGAAPAIVVAAPAHHGSTGTPGQLAYDSSGNFYMCFAVNSWMQIGPGGYSVAF